MKKLLIVVLVLGMAAIAQAVPTLQVGAPAGPGDTGTYANYQLNLTNPTETDTAVTSGNVIFVGAVFGPHDLLIGGQYTDPANPSITPLIEPGTKGDDWTDLRRSPFPSVFDGKGAVLLASVPEGSSGSLKIDLGAGEILPFYTSTTTSLFPDNHDPVKENIADFLFFDLGNFAKLQAVPDFCESGELGCDSSSGTGTGQIKPVIFTLSGYDWVHFDVMALVTYANDNNGKKYTKLVTSLDTNLDKNPGSHDVTWHDNGGGGGQDVPEPGTILLLGSGLVGVALYGRKKLNKYLN